MSFCLGVMGLGRGDFLDLTPFEYLNVKEQFYKNKDDERQKQWEMARWMVFKYHCPPEGRKVGKQTLLSLQDFIVFPWEEKQKEAEKSTEERFRAAVKRYEKLTQHEQ